MSRLRHVSTVVIHIVQRCTDTSDCEAFFTLFKNRSMKPQGIHNK